MKNVFTLLKQGNKSAAMAAIINTILAIIKGFAYLLTGNVAMFAETLHSLGDAANQFFVFIGSALSKKAPTDRFPNGFGRLVNLVLLGAVIIVGIFSYETIKEGIHHIIHPVASEGVWISVSVLLVASILEGFVLYKASKEVLHETGTEAKGFAIIPKAFANMKNAKPATKLVFMEDTVATGGALLALVAIVISHFTSFDAANGIASVLIGIMMFAVIGKVFLDNAAGVIGEADEEMEEKIGRMVMSDPEVKDIETLTVIKEGEDLHVELEVEVDPSLTVAQADDIKDRLEAKIMQERGVSDVSIEFDEDDGVNSWEKEQKSKVKTNQA